MMLSIPAAARGQARFAPRTHRKERLNKWQTHKSKQRDGEKSTQCSY
jgi:hypothetical protein